MVGQESSYSTDNCTQLGTRAHPQRTSIKLTVQGSNPDWEVLTQLGSQRLADEILEPETVV